MRLAISFVRFGKKQLHNLLLEMNKERTILKAARSKMPTTKYPAGTVSLQVLGNSVYLFTDQTRYLFNCGEGTQRLAHEHKMKLAKLEHVFLTHNRWSCFGGLPGVALTLQDIGVGTINVHGPPGIDRLFLSTRRFIILNDLEIRALNACRGFDYEDHILRVNYVPLYDDKNEVLEKNNKGKEDEDTTDYYSASRRKMINVVSDERDKEDAEELKKNVAICYICQIKKKEGTLLIDKCIAKGVPPGPLLGKLKSGEDITLADGRVVLASDVRTVDCPGPAFLVIDCPTLSHLDSLINNENLKKYQKEIFTNVVVHFTSQGIMATEKYRNWMEEFNISTKHLVINEELAADGSEAVHKMQTKLNHIDEQTFPELKLRESGQLKLNVPAIVGNTLFKVNLRPLTDIDLKSIPVINREKYIEDLTSNPEFVEELSTYKSRSTDYKKSKSSILFLGTGSSIPNKTRNVSAILLNIDDKNSMLLDCGEGTLQQLKRHHDYENILNNLKAIYISHLHADHHLGLISFLRLKKLIVFAPCQISSWLNLYSSNFEPLDYELVGCHQLYRPFNVDGLGLESMKTCLVRHCPNAFGVSLVTKEGYKVTYSGDTMPCTQLVELGRDSDILIHEATMENGLEEEAVKKMHSTVGQAIEMGSLMNAKFTILTHFSQRYAKIPLIENLNENVGAAFDNMKVNLGAVRRISGLMSMVSKGFSDDFEEVKGRAVKRQNKKDLKASMAV